MRSLALIRPDEDLDQIAATIRDTTEEVKNGLLVALEGNLKIGRALLSARSRLPTDQAFGEWFDSEEFGFSRVWGWTLRAAAEDEAAVRQAVVTQVTTGKQPNIKAALAVVRGRPEPIAIEVTPAYTALLEAMKAIEQLKAHQVAELATSIPVKSRERWVRRIRKNGTLLGHIAYIMEEGDTDAS